MCSLVTISVAIAKEWEARLIRLIDRDRAITGDRDQTAVLKLR